MHAEATVDPFETLFAAEYPRVVAVARRFVGAEAEDVAQDVFAALARNPIDEPVHARAWLHRAAVHRAITFVRSRRRRTARELRDSYLESARNGAIDPHGAVERHETGEELRRALGRLSERHAGVLALRAAGLDYKELAAIFRVTPNAIGALLVRAEAALRKELSGDPSFR